MLKATELCGSDAHIGIARRLRPESRGWPVRCKGSRKNDQMATGKDGGHLDTRKDMATWIPKICTGKKGWGGFRAIAWWEMGGDGATQAGLLGAGPRGHRMPWQMQVLRGELGC